MHSLGIISIVKADMAFDSSRDSFHIVVGILSFSSTYVLLSKLAYLKVSLNKYVYVLRFG